MLFDVLLITHYKKTLPLTAQPCSSQSGVLMEAAVTPTQPSNSCTLPPPVPLRPAVAPSVQLGFTILYTTLYAGLFLVVYAQLWLLYHYRHKRCSYQSVFLFLCLFWAALRTTLFSFYFRNALEANHLPVPVYWLLYCFPVCLQFFTLSLINLYFTQVRLVTDGQDTPEGLPSNASLSRDRK